MEACLPGDGQSDLAALLIRDRDGALAGELFLHDQLWKAEAGLHFLVPALCSGHGDGGLPAVLLDLGSSELQRKIDLEEKI